MFSYVIMNPPYNDVNGTMLHYKFLCKALEVAETKNQFGYAVKRVLEITEADRLEDIKGKPVRAKFTGNGSLGDTLIGIGHLLRENWLIPREDSMWNDEIKDDEED